MELLVQDGNIEHGCHYLNKGAECCREKWTPFLDTPRHTHKAQTGSYHSLHESMIRSHVEKS